MALSKYNNLITLVRWSEKDLKYAHILYLVVVA